MTSIWLSRVGRGELARAGSHPGNPSQCDEPQAGSTGWARLQGSKGQGPKGWWGQVLSGRRDPMLSLMGQGSKHHCLLADALLTEELSPAQGCTLRTHHCHCTGCVQSTATAPYNPVPPLPVLPAMYPPVSPPAAVQAARTPLPPPRGTRVVPLLVPPPPRGDTGCKRRITYPCHTVCTRPSATPCHRDCTHPLATSPWGAGWENPAATSHTQSAG